MLLDRYFKIPIRHGLVIQISLIVCALMYIPMFSAWDKTIHLLGSDHSITLISCMFVMGMITTGSDVVWLPYMSQFEDQYLPAYFLGASVSGVLPGVLSVVQGMLV